MGLSMSSTNFEQQHLFFLSFLSFCLAPCGAHPFVPTRELSCAPRAGEVKDGRRPNHSPRRSFPGHSLTGPSTAARLGPVGIDRPVAFPPAASKRRSEASLPSVAQRSRATSLYSVDPRGSNHDAVMRIGGEAPRRQAHSFFRHRSHRQQRVTATSDHLGIHLARKRINAQICVGTLLAVFIKVRSYRWTQDGAGRNLADRDVAPQSDQQFACQGDDHGFAQSWLGSCRSRSIPLRQGTFVLELEPPPCQLDHAVAHPCIAGSGQSPFAALVPTFIWRACQAP